VYVCLRNFFYICSVVCSCSNGVGVLSGWEGEGVTGGRAEGGAGRVAVESAWVRLRSRATTGLRPGVEWTCRLCL
jgi:hypothetical protein